MFEYGQTHLYKSTNHDQKIHGAPINKSSKYCFSAVRRSRSTRTSSSSCCAATWPWQPLQFMFFISHQQKNTENRTTYTRKWYADMRCDFWCFANAIATDDNQPNPGVKEPELQEESLWTEHSELLSSPFTDWMCHQDYQTSGLCNLTKCCPVLECKHTDPNIASRKVGNLLLRSVKIHQIWSSVALVRATLNHIIV